ncbi:MAG: GNAT family N-acetyltransferase [Thermoplasmata archaeon]
MRIETVTADRHDFMRFLAQDEIRNAFALYDLEEEAERVECHAAIEAGSFGGYLLAWHGRQHPNVLMTGTEEAARTLLPRAPPSPCTFLLAPDLVAAVEGKREIGARRRMYFMTVDSMAFRSVEGERPARLGEEDAKELKVLYRAAVEEPRDWGDWARKGLAYGIWRKGRLVAVAGTHFVARRYSLIGGVYTDPRFRRRGFAASLTSAVTRDALQRSDQVGLMVVSTNQAAIRLYEKLGYRKGVEWVWLDSGTGHVPLA